MSEKLKILLLVMLVLGFISVISDSGPSLQQTLGIIIAIFILHFYTQKNFDEIQQASVEGLKKYEDLYRFDKPLITKEVPLKESPVTKERMISSNRPEMMPAYVQNEQTDPYRQTAMQSWPMEDWHKRNSTRDENIREGMTCPISQSGRRIDDHLIVDQQSHDHQLYRDPAKSVYNQQKMLRNARFFEKQLGQELRRAEERVWYEDAYLC